LIFLKLDMSQITGQFGHVLTVLYSRRMQFARPEPQVDPRLLHDDDHSGERGSMSRSQLG
jgi:hypothetical protein